MDSVTPTNSQSPNSGSLRRLVEIAMGIREDEDLEGQEQADLAFEAIYERLQGGLCAYVRKKITKLSSYDLDSITQECWVIAWTGLNNKSYDPNRSAFTTYLYAIAGKLVLRYFERHKREAKKIIRMQQNPRLQESADELAFKAVEDAEEVEMLQRYLNATSQDLNQEEVSLLRLLAKDMPEREIANHLDCSPATAHNRKAKLINKLKTLLSNKARQGNNQSGGLSSV